MMISLTPKNWQKKTYGTITHNTVLVDVLWKQKVKRKFWLNLCECMCVTVHKINRKAIKKQTKKEKVKN